MKSSHGMLKVQFPIQDNTSQKYLFRVIHIGSMENQHPCLRPNGLEAYQIIFTTAGEGLLTVNGKEYIISEGMGFLLPPGMPHQYRALTAPWTTYWVLFDGSGAEMIPFIALYENDGVFYIRDMQKLLFHHKTIYSYAEQESFSNQNALSAACYHLLLDMDECTEKTPIKTRDDQWKKIAKVMDYMEENFQKDFILEDVAALAGITPQYLCKLFKNRYHMRPMEYILHLRIREAKQLLLVNRKMPLNIIAEYVGYHDTSYFCRMFKQSTGMTPGEFRNNS